MAVIAYIQCLTRWILVILFGVTGNTNKVQGKKE